LQALCAGGSLGRGGKRCATSVKNHARDLAAARGNAALFGGRGVGGTGGGKNEKTAAGTPSGEGDLYFGVEDTGKKVGGRAGKRPVNETGKRGGVETARSTEVH